MKNASSFALKVLFVFKIFRFLFCLFDPVEKLLDEVDKVNSKIHDTPTWETNNCNTHIVLYLKK